MASSDFDAFRRPASPALSAEDAYQDGYDRVLRELAWAEAHGFVPSERQLVRAILETMRVYTVAQGGRFVAGRHPEWLRGRAEALRSLLQAGATDATTDLPADD